MESINFLKEKLQDLSVRLPYLNIRYEYRDIIDTHIVEVKPLDYFDRDHEYIQLQIDLEESFEAKFPNEEIIFISENSLTEVRNPILELGLSAIKVDIPLFEFNKITFGDEILWQSLRSYFDYMILDYQRSGHIDNSYRKCMPAVMNTTFGDDLSNIWGGIGDVVHEFNRENRENNQNNSIIYSEPCSEFFFTNIAA